MRRFYQRAVKDILDNRFLTAITVATIALSILIAAAFALFFINAGDVLNIWQKGIRMMVYLKPDTSDAGRLDTKYRLQSIAGVQETRFISKEEAMQKLKQQMAHYSALLDNLKENPLPDAFEISVKPTVRNSTELSFLAERIGALSTVDEVEYGQRWIQRFSNIISLFRLAGYGIGALFFMATVFIVANTIRLVLYSRRDEIEIMRLVGATDRFIKVPFYLQGMIQGGLGTLIGLLVLLAGYYSLTTHFSQSASGQLITLRFFSLGNCAAIICGGVMVGWLGCWVSLKQFMKG
ncbi:MAG: permease-like cell division protein FtsX [Desulfobacteraceae bacterium]|jgi:cell division transport system permease protein